MSRRVMLNTALVVVLVLIGGATFAAVRNSPSSSATTETLATAKKGTVLESVTSTGNVEAPTSLSLSFQQSGKVTDDLRQGRRTGCEEPGARPRRRHAAAASARIRKGIADSAAGRTRGAPARRDRRGAIIRRALDYVRGPGGHPGPAGCDERPADTGRERHEVPAGDRPGADLGDERAGRCLERAGRSEPGRAAP